MGYEPFYHALKTIILLAPSVGYEIIIANSIHTSLAIVSYSLANIFLSRAIGLNASRD